MVRASSQDHDERSTIIELSTDLLEVIFSRLNLKDNIRASAVCKRWLAVATSVRVVTKPPLLMFLPKVGNLFNFYDPGLRKTYCLEMPELEGTRLCHAMYGWLLLFHPETHRIFFFCPYTRDSIQLPNLHVTHQVVFSAPPKSPDCIVMTIKYNSPTIVTICMWTKLCFSEGRLYCLSLTGWLGGYDTVKKAWFIHIAPPSVDHLLEKSSITGRFMAEHEGNLFLIYTCCSANPIVYELDETERIWVEVANLGSLTIFANSLSSHCRIDLPGNMRNNIFSPRFYILVIAACRIR